jgi:hypothetical protein
MTNKLTALVTLLKRCETQPACVSEIKPEEITLARQCVEAVIQTRAALAEIDAMLQAAER